MEQLQNDEMFSHLHEEYELLKSESEILDEDLEICIDNSGVVFLIRLRIDVSLIRSYLQS